MGRQGEEGSKDLLGRRKSTKRRARRDVLELVHDSPVSMRCRCSSIGELAPRGSSLLSTSPSYRHCDDAMLLK